MILNAGQDLKLNGGGSVAIVSGERMDIVAKTILNTYGGTGMTSIDNASSSGIAQIVSLFTGGTLTGLDILNFSKQLFR